MKNKEIQFLYNRRHITEFIFNFYWLFEIFIQIKILPVKMLATCAIFLRSATDYDFSIYQHTAHNMRYPTEERIEIHYKETGLERQETRRKYFVYMIRGRYWVARFLIKSVKRAISGREMHLVSSNHENFSFYEFRSIFLEIVPIMSQNTANGASFINNNVVIRTSCPDHYSG